MKQLTLAIPAALCLITAIAKAQVPQFAVLKTDKACEVAMPAAGTSNPPYFSKDCQTAYILPSKTIPMRVSKAAFLAGAGMCQDWARNNEYIAISETRIEKMKDLVTKAQERRDNATTEQDRELEQKKIDSLKSEIVMFKADLDARRSRFSNIKALRAAITVADDSVAQIAAFQLASAGYVARPGVSSPTRFVGGLVGNSYLNISPKDAKTDEIRDILNVNFPSGEVAKRDPENPLGYRVPMNGGLSGIIDVSTEFYCMNVDRLNKDPQEGFSKLVALNLEYDVKAQAGVTIHIDGEFTVPDMLKSVQAYVRKGRWTRDEWSTATVRATVNNTLKILIDDNGAEVPFLVNDLLDPKKDGDSQFVGKIAGQFIKSHSELVLDLMKNLELTKAPEQLTPQEVANGFEKVHVGDNRVCTSSSSWFGFSSSRSCHTVPIYVMMDRDGVSALGARSNINLKYGTKATISSNQTITVKHTTTFHSEQ